MPPRNTAASGPDTSSSGSRRRCKAYTTAGTRCKRAALPGLTVCKAHGGGTAASTRVVKATRAGARAAMLWGISTDTSGISLEDELRQLARNKLTDVTALRLKISEDEIGKHIGMLASDDEVTTYAIDGTVQSKHGQQRVRHRRASTSPWVQELHKAEAELLAILRMIADLNGDTDPLDTKRLAAQVARATARLMRAYPGISVDEVVGEVTKNAQH